MKTSKLFRSASVLSLAFCLSLNLTFARSGGEGEKLKAPDKTIGVASLDNFVSGCFSLYETIHSARSTFNLLQGQTGVVTIPDIESLIGKYKELGSLISTLLPKADSLFQLSSSIPDHLKDVPIMKYLRAGKNIKLAIEAITYSVTQSKNLAFKDIPSVLQSLSGKRSNTSADTTKTPEM